MTVEDFVGILIRTEQKREIRIVSIDDGIEKLMTPCVWYQKKGRKKMLIISGYEEQENKNE